MQKDFHFGIIMIHPHPKHMVVTSSNLSNEMFEFNDQSGYTYSILEVSDIFLIILLDKQAHINNITLIIW